MPGSLLKRVLVIELVVLLGVLGVGFAEVRGRGRDDSPPPLPRPLQEVPLIAFDASWCKHGCIGLAAWEQLVEPVPLLRGAMAIAYTVNPQWRPLAREAAIRGTRVVVGDLPPSTGGSYNISTNVITINREVLDEPSSVVAAIVAHEIAHVSQDHSLRSAATCIADEMEAMAWTASTYEKTRLGTEASRWARDFTSLVTEWHANQIQQHVLGIPGYQRGCLGGLLPEY